MKILKIRPGPKVGQVLEILLGEVLDEPERNKKDYLEKRIEELGGLDEEELISLAETAKENKAEVITKRDEMTKKRYWVS